jgi:phosphate transport system substrate-binding protein
VAGREGAGREGHGARRVAGGLRGTAATAATALAGLALACAVTACATADGGTRAVGATELSAVSAPGLTISETGSTLLAPLAATWARDYHAQNPEVTVTTAATGSGTGIKDASDGSADIGASDAYLSSGDLVKNPALLNIALAVSAQTIIYNLPTLPAGTHVQLDGGVLAGIYSGTITMWNDHAIEALNQGLSLPALKIVPVRRSDSSGDTFLFTSYLSTQNAGWNTSIGYGTTADWPTVSGEQAAKGSTNVLKACEDHSGCVAYNGISYLHQAQTAGLGEAALDNSAGKPTLPGADAIAASVGSFVSLTPPNETISMIDGPAADGYPIVNYEYAVVSTDQPNAAKAAAIRAFLTWVITTGNNSSYLNTVGFQALSNTLVTLGKAQIAEIGS